MYRKVFKLLVKMEVASLQGDYCQKVLQDAEYVRFHRFVVQRSIPLHMGYQYLHLINTLNLY